MYMSNMNVSYDTMKEAAGRLNAGKDELTTKLTELENVINNLRDNGFQTDAAGPAYGESYQKFSTGTKSAVEGLQGLSDFLTQAADALANTDQELAKGISA